MTGSDAPARVRVFFALWPDAALAAALHRHAVALTTTCGGRAMRRDTLHLTLVFVGDVAVESLDGLEACGRAAAETFPAFAFDLDAFGYWPHNHIVWAGCRETPAALAALAARLRTQLEQSGFALEKRPFAAHVTLLRHARCGPPPTMEGIPWRAGALYLMASARSHEGADYRVLGAFPFTR